MRTVLSVLVAIVPAACGLSTSHRSTDAAVHHDVFTEPDKSVDVLFVVDDSPSMIEEQSHLAESLQPFLERLIEVHADYHIAVITPDVQARGVMRAFDGPSVEGCDGCRVLTSDVPCPSPGVDTSGLSDADADAALASACPARLVFRHLLSTGANGAPFEAAFDLAEVALGIKATSGGTFASLPTPPPENSAFSRAGVHLALVFVSDEDEGAKNAAPPVTSYLDAFRVLWPDVQVFALTGYAADATVALPDVCGVLATTFDADASNDDPHASALLTTLANQSDGCRDAFAPNDINGSAETGTRYIELACRTGGAIESICTYATEDRGASMASALSGVSRPLILRTPASQIAQDPLDCDGDGRTDGALDGPLCVTATDASTGARGLVIEDREHGFFYDASANAVTFAGAFVPLLESDVEVSYRVK